MRNVHITTRNNAEFETLCGLRVAAKALVSLSVWHQEVQRIYSPQYLTRDEQWCSTCNERAELAVLTECV